MSRLNFSISCLAVFSIILLSGCIKENPDLVNPPAVWNTVRIRMINLAGDYGQRSLSLTGKKISEEVQYGTVSKSISPEADSGFVGVQKQGNEEFTNSSKSKFTRYAKYTYLALPSPDLAPTPRLVDTIIAISPVLGEVIRERKAYLNVVNAFPDTTVKYTVTLGCPNGTAIASNVLYRGTGGGNLYPAGNIAVSLVRIRQENREIVNLYKMKLDSAFQYTIVISRSSTGLEELMLMNHFDSTQTALQALPVSEKRETEIRPVNFNDGELSAFKQDEEITTSLAPRSLGSYKPLGACGSELPDTISTNVNGSVADSISTMLQVAVRYHLLSFPSPQSSTGYKSLLVSPIDEPTTGMASIKVVNLNYNQPSYTISLGARMNPTRITSKDSSGYETGIVLASDTAKAAQFSTVNVYPGNLPVFVFTKTQPAHFITCAIGSVEAGGKYLLIFTHIDGEDRLCLIEENSTAGTLPLMEKAVFAQFINFTPGPFYNRVSIGSMLNDIHVNYMVSLATAIPAKELQVLVDDNPYSVAVEQGKRLIMVTTGNASNRELLSYIVEPPVTDLRNVYRRFLNVSREVPVVDVRDGCLKCTIIEAGLQFGAFSQWLYDYRDMKNAYYFTSPTEEKIYAKSGSMQLNVGKYYTLIFGGNQETGYNFIPLEEY